MRIFFWICILVLTSNTVKAQTPDIEQIVENTLREKQTEWGLSQEDIATIAISSHHTSKRNGVTHIYINQTLDDIPIYNAINNIHITKEGRLLRAENNFISNAHQKVKFTKSKLSPVDALTSFKLAYDIQSNQTAKQLKSKTTEDKIEFAALDYSNNNIPVQLMYYPVSESELRLVWQVDVDLKNSTDYWSSFIDAQSGELLHSHNYTTSCHFHKHIYTNTTRECVSDHSHLEHAQPINTSQQTVDDGSTYLVYPVPLENPLQGDQAIVESPALALASPQGWHSTDTIAGPDFTITRGNNVHAFSNDSGTGRSQGDEPDGGDALSFQFEHDKLGEPDENIDSDVTQLFYISNWIHDFSYFFGFDEAAGNFQESNFGKDGRGSDYIMARAVERQLSNNVPVTNNARFSSPSDGSNGVMIMFPWVASDTDLNILSPGRRAVPHSNPAFGIPDASLTISGQIAISLDSGGVSEFDACDSITNATDLAGKIAFVDRGECDFSFKVNQLQNAGAIAVVVCNRDEEFVTMGAGEDAEFVNIFSSFIRRSDCDSILAVLNSGTPVQMELVYTTPIPAQVSGSFDNGVTVHEYGHGISIRMTGGRNNSGCLSADEQMGEGWSDFFSLVATHKAGDRGEDARGLGIYLDRLSSNTSGIRRFPYSTDFDINAQTYNDIRFTGYLADGDRRGEHEVGEIWASALWDMYWAFVGAYGFNEDWMDTDSGNNKAIQLVFDALSLQKCNPGLLDGRDAILTADEVLFEGENACLIWDTFARRGLGVDAIQGSSFDREDNFEGFITAPSCQNKLVIKKTTTPIIEAGDVIDVSIVVTNNTTEVLNTVSVTDVVPPGTTPTALDQFNPEYNEGDNMINFNIGNLDPFNSIEINFQLATSSTETSTPILFDDFAAPIVEPESLFGTVFWSLEDNIDEGPIWRIPSPVDVFDQVLTFSETVRVEGERPVFQFRHQYDVELFFAGADVELSTNGGQTWNSIEKDKFLANGYNDDVIFKNNDDLAFTGDSDGFVESVIDLQEYIGQDILIRFRFTSNVAGGFADVATSQPGWTIANMRIYDLNAYDLNEACVSSAGKDTVCDGATTIIKADDTIATNDELKAEYGFSIYPNPSRDQMTIQFDAIDLKEAILRISSLDGSVISMKTLNIKRSHVSEVVSLDGFASGFYIVELIGQDLRISDKLIVLGE